MVIYIATTNDHNDDTVPRTNKSITSTYQQDHIQKKDGLVVNEEINTNNHHTKITTTNSATNTTTTTIKRKRDKLSPKPILDQKLLLEALAQNDIILKPTQLETFYQLLHRQGYPSLPDFVTNYYTNEHNKMKFNTYTNTNALSDENNNNQINFSNNTKITTTTSSSSLKSKNLRALPKSFLTFLSNPNNDFTTLTSHIHEQYTSQDGTTTKLAVKLQDGHIIESVIMRHETSVGTHRVTICVSSQVGCAMGCTFCATGTMGIRGNLSCGEILEQLVHAQNLLNTNNATNTTTTHEQDGNDVNSMIQSIRNVVFMGMGEPLNNYSNVIAACRAMIDRRRWNLAHGRVTVSTVGVTPKMRQLTKELPEVNLALSLHAPNQVAREAIVPTAKMYPIEDMIEALDEHMMALTIQRKRNDCVTSGIDGDELMKGNSQIVNQNYGMEERKSASKRKRAMIEYVMLEGETSTFECAHQLGKLCENKHLVVNLIPYNQTNVKDKYKCPSEDHMKEFQQIVTSYGAFCYIRRTMGADIAGACGQLVVENENKSIERGRELHLQKEHDIEDGPVPFQHSNQHSNTTKTNTSSISNGKTHRSKVIDKDNAEKNNMDRWIKPLAVATGLAASCFVVSVFIFMSQQRRRR